MNYIICKTFQGQDEVIVHKQWDLEMGRKGGRGKRKGQDREREGGRERDSMTKVTTYKPVTFWYSSA